MSDTSQCTALVAIRLVLCANAANVPCATIAVPEVGTEPPSQAKERMAEITLSPANYALPRMPEKAIFAIKVRRAA